MANSWIIKQIDLEISRLQQARQLLIRSEINNGISYKMKSNEAMPGSKRGKLSPDGRARIVAAQKARWAKLKTSTLSV